MTTDAGGNAVPQNPYLFKGGIQDRTTGWVHYGARWYNPTTGRWTQQDTLDNPLDPANANRYAYAGDDPFNNLDATGLSACTDYYGAVSGTAGAVGVGLGILAIGTSETVVGGLTFGGLALLAGGVSAGTYLMGLVTYSIVDS